MREEAGLELIFYVSTDLFNKHYLSPVICQALPQTLGNRDENKKVFALEELRDT